MNRQSKALVTSLALLAVFVGSSAFADGVVLETPIAYAKDASVNERVRTECHVEDLLERHISTYMQKVQRGATGSASGAAVLKIEIAHVMGVGGGSWSGPKAITVDATLMVDGKVKRQGKVSRWSNGGFWAGLKGTCGILERDAKAIGKDLSRWVKDPRYVMPIEAEPPKEAASAASSAAEADEH